VERLVRPTSLDPPRLYEARIDAVAELGHDHHVVCQDSLFFGLLCLQLTQVRHPQAVDTLDPAHSPETLVTLLDLATGRKQPHLVAPAHSSRRQLNGLRLVLLEDQSEGAPLRQGSDLGFEVLAQLFVGPSRLP
jgi:hypothetical protein